ncbi:FAD-dependent oxidoreductase [Streptomyces sp. NPDC001941]|uniref:NAD(P)/FAD-dependent oxidoreductase n=1 Tax=Streptomyces sp. NPDC001941 TaxID=3154659 RepID=UPI00331D7FDE
MEKPAPAKAPGDHRTSRREPARHAPGRQAPAHRVLVLGAGRTGLLVTLLLARRTRRARCRPTARGPRVHVTLVNPSERFTERPRVHQVAAGQELARYDVTALLAGTGVDFVRGRAQRIDTGAREVVVAAEDGARVLPYDTLVIALGVTTDTGAVPGAGAHALTLDDPRAAHRLAGRLAALAAAGGSLTVCGCGAAGVEAAAEIAESHPGLRVTLVGRDRPGAGLGDRARAHLDAALGRLGVRVVTGEVVRVLPGALALADGTLLRTDACLWTAGTRGPGLAAGAGLATDARGRVEVDGSLRSLSHPEVYAVGGAAAVRGTWHGSRGFGGSGLPSAAHAAGSIVRRLRGKRAGRPWSRSFHRPVGLGRRDAVVQFTRADGTPVPGCLTGRAAVAYRALLGAGPVRLYGLLRA